LPVLSQTDLNPVMTNRAAPDFERMIGLTLHNAGDWKGTRP
jgi:hypothetical protein